MSAFPLMLSIQTRVDLAIALIDRDKLPKKFIVDLAMVRVRHVRVHDLT